MQNMPNFQEDYQTQIIPLSNGHYLSFLRKAELQNCILYTCIFLWSTQATAASLLCFH